MLLTPFPEYKLSARVLNNYHLVLSLRVLKQIHSAIIYPKGHSKELAVALWKDAPKSLLDYGYALSMELEARKLPDPKDWTWIKTERDGMANGNSPFWLGNHEWHKYHRGVATVHDPVWYNSLFVKLNVGYIGSEYSKNPSAIFEATDISTTREHLIPHTLNLRTCRG